MFRRWPTASDWTSNVATGLSPLGHRICIVSRMRPVFPMRASLGCGDTLNLHSGTSTADSRQSSLCLRLTQMIYQANNHEWPNPLAPAHSRRAFYFRLLGELRSVLASSELGFPAAVAERER
jgi:hypothetical protein